MFSKKTDWNGHKNRNHWNVNLWLWNDERLYSLTVDAVRAARRQGGTLDDAAAAILRTLHDQNKTHTPDGALYSKTAIRAALRDLDALA